MMDFIRKHKIKLITALLLFIAVSGTLFTYALWEERLSSSEEGRNRAAVWNESEKYLVFTEIKEGALITAYAVSGYDGIIDTVEIPRSHSGKPVTTIKGVWQTTPLQRGHYSGYRNNY